MKKIMIAAAIVCAAVVSEAATIQWNISNVTKDDTAVSGVSYFINNAELSRTAMLALAGQGAEKVIDALSAKNIAASAAAVTSGAKANGDKVDNGSLGLSNATSYDFYMVVFDSSTITDSSNFYVSDLKTGQKTADGSSNKVIGFGSQAGKTGATAWNAVGGSEPTPEPTSGLLLLLGVAGLALRRKQ